MAPKKKTIAKKSATKRLTKKGAAPKMSKAPKRTTKKRAAKKAAHGS